MNTSNGQFSGRVARWRLALAGLALAGACGGDDSGTGSSTGQRAGVLNLSAGQVAQAALGDTPNADFVSARLRVEKRVPTERVTYARSFSLSPTRTPITTDPTFIQVRVDAATALGTNIDPNKAADAASANSSLDALLAEIVKYSPTATSCDGLPAPKNDACAFALIIMEVLRSEAPHVDAGVVSMSDGGTPDSGKPSGGDAGVLTPVNLFACPASRDLTGATSPMDDTIETSTTWSGKILLKGDTYVTGGTLTIMPGTQIFLDVDATLQIGWNASTPTVNADATAAAPITFCGATGTPGFWGSVIVGNKVASNSVLRNVLFSDGGGSDVALKLQSALTADNVQVRNARKDGVWASDFKPDSKALSVEGVGGEALVFTTEDALTHFPLGGTLANNVSNEAILRFDTYKNTTVVHALSVPYVQEETIDQTAGDITFEAGVDYRFKPDLSLEIGWNSGITGLHINGTADKPVKFGPWQPGVARWAGFLIDAKVTTNSNVTYAEFSGGASLNTPVLQIAAPVSIDHVTVSDNLVGVSLKGPLAAAGKNLTITKTKGRPLTVVPDALFTIPVGGTFTGNDIDQIAIDGDTINKGAGTIGDYGVPYFVTQSIDQYDGSYLTIAPGTDFVMNADVLLTIGWNSGKSSLIAKGTAAAPITFTGAMPTAGFWTGILVNGSVLSTTVFDYVQIGHAGGGGGAALELKAPYPTTNTPVAVTNSRFFTYMGYGILKSMAVTFDYQTSNTFDGMTVGSN